MIRTPTRAGALFAAVLLAGCAGNATRPELPLELPARFSTTGEQALPAQWWQAFDDPALGTLIEGALADNFSLRATWARLEQARAVANREGAARWPTLDARGEISRQNGRGSREGEQRLVGASAAYEVDLWGRVGSAADAAELDARASGADLQTAALTLSAEVADTWYQLVEQRAQRDLLDEQMTLNRQLLTLVEARFRIGQAEASDVHRQRQLLAQTQGELVQSDTQLASLSYRLALLLGKAPGVELPAQRQLPTPGPLPATGLPAELAQRRPDLRRAFLQLQAADARAAAAVAARYPRLDLSAATSSRDGRLEHWLSNLVAQIAAPLFDGGRRRADAERAQAALTEAVNNYAQAVLDALREVEDALNREAGQTYYLASLATQEREAEAVVERERLRYLQGDSDYLSVIDALRSRQQLQRQLITGRRELLSRRITLVRSLAGGWSLEPVPPQTAQDN